MPKLRAQEGSCGDQTAQFMRPTGVQPSVPRRNPSVDGVLFVEVDETLVAGNVSLAGDASFGGSGSFGFATTGPFVPGRQDCPRAACKIELKACACSRGVLSIVK